MNERAAPEDLADPGTADDAIDFCYACGLELTFIFGYRLVDGQYEEDESVQSEVLDSDW